MTSANRTPREKKFASLVASQQWQANRHEPACSGIASPQFFPSHSDILLHFVIQPYFFLQRFICHETFCPLFRRPVPFLLVVGCSSPLVGADAESSEGLPGNTPSTRFPGLPRSPRPPIFKTSRTSAVSYSSCAPQFPRTRSDALTSHLDKRAQIGYWLVGAIFLWSSHAVSQEVAVGSGQRIVVARAWNPLDAAVQHCLEYLGNNHPDFELEGRSVGRTVRGCTSGICTM